MTSKWNINNTTPTCQIDTDWNLTLSHGTEANYLVHGEVIELLIGHIKYLELLIQNCPGNKQ